MNIKSYIKSKPLIYYTILKTLIFFLSFPIKIKRGFRKHPNMLKGEIKLFKEIYSECKIIVDVGARYDTDYIDISKKNDKEYYLFEANPNYFNLLKQKTSKFKEKLVLENLAVGEEEKFVNYYEDSESILKNTTAVKDSKKELPSKIKMIRLDSYFKNIQIKNIDFLKTDIEEYDYFALKGLGNLLLNCKYIQFELGIGAPYNGDVVKK